MKVKEEYSPEFRKTKGSNIVDRVLKEKGDLFLIEMKDETDKYPHSTFLIYDNKINWAYIEVWIPDLKEKELYKTLFLKYQIGMKRFLKDFFDVLVGEREDVRIMYKAKQSDGLSSVVEDSNVLIKLEDGYVLATIAFFNKNKERDIELSSKIAEKIIKYFEGETVSFSEEVNLCEQ